jgi:surface antigen
MYAWRNMLPCDCASSNKGGTTADALARRKEFLRLQQATAGFSRQSQFVHVVVKVSLVVLIGLFFVGGFVGVSVKGAHAQSAVGHSLSQTAHADTANSVPKGSYNWFPYPACTWWADQRYHELHGAYVPWKTQADAWEWTARAQQFGWKVSTRASMGAIINLQPWVQGAYGLGHVAVVEKVYSDGSVLASNMSWGSNIYQVVDVHFYPGAGVTFIQI